MFLPEKLEQDTFQVVTTCHETNISLIAKSYDIFNFVRNPGWGYKNIISKVEDGLSRSKLEYYGTYLQQPSFVIGESSF